MTTVAQVSVPVIDWKQPDLHAQKPKPAEEFIAAVPPIEVDGLVAVCDGGVPTSPHPLEYIQLNKRKAGEPETCKYCGLRYVAKQDGHH